MTIPAVPILSGYLTSAMTSPNVSPEMPRDLIDATVIVTVAQIKDPGLRSSTGGASVKLMGHRLCAEPGSRSGIQRRPRRRTT
jgi:hypothetical protein